MRVYYLIQDRPPLSGMVVELLGEITGDDDPFRDNTWYLFAITDRGQLHAYASIEDEVWKLEGLDRRLVIL